MTVTHLFFLWKLIHIVLFDSLNNSFILFLVSFGGIAGLFLGFSLLTIIEFVYWGIKFLIYQYNKPSSSTNKITPKY